MTPSRRTLMMGAGSLAALAAARPGSGLAQQEPRSFDLVIKGGEVIDPSQGLRAQRDLGIRGGTITAIEETIPEDRADRLLDATGMIVTPGLVDFHTHVFPYGSAIGIAPDELAPLTCTTTAVSAGDAGANNVAALKRYVAGQSRTRIHAFVHIANFGLAGFPVPEMLNIDHAEVENCARAVAASPEFCLGVKVRESVNVVGVNGLEPLRRAIRAAELAGPWARVMCHIGDAPGDLAELMGLLREGDVVTHAYAGSGNNIVQEGRVLPAVRDARERGVLFGVGHGGGSFDYTVAEPALEQGFAPDFISSDIHVFSGNSPGQPYLPNVMSKFLGLGMSLEEVVARSTSGPGRAIDRDPMLGTLQLGGAADVAVMELVEGEVEFVDTAENTRTAERRLEPRATIRAGVPFGQPYGSPFSRG